MGCCARKPCRRWRALSISSTPATWVHRRCWRAWVSWRRPPQCAATTTPARGRRVCQPRSPSSWTACRLHLVHDVSELAVTPSELGIRAVIAGHSHRPAIRESGGVLYLNPGSAGPRRFSLPISVAWLEIDNGTLRARLVELRL